MLFLLNTQRLSKFGEENTVLVHKCDHTLALAPTRLATRELRLESTLLNTNITLKTQLNRQRLFKK